MAGSINVKDWILAPALITLGVTVVRLLGELWGGPQILFGSEAGGGASLIGIVWLVFVFGAYFGRKLVRLGHGPTIGLGRVALWLLLAFVVVIVGGVLGQLLAPNNPWIQLPVVGLFSVFGIVVGRRAWPEAGQVLTAYGLAARIPVAILMLPAILYRWGTHYDKPPPGFPEGISPLGEWFLIGLIPQLTSWVAITVIFGGFAAVIAAALTKR